MSNLHEQLAKMPNEPFKLDMSKTPIGFHPIIKYRIDNSGCFGAYVPGYGDQSLWDTQESAIEAARILSTHPEHKWRRNPYEIVKLDISAVPEEEEEFAAISPHARVLEIIEINFNDAATSQTKLPETVR